MFIFRSRRTALSKRLWRARARRRNDEEGGEIQEVLEGTRLQSTLKRLKENQLEMLLSVVESRGSDNVECVLVDRSEVPHDPHAIVCRTWRWPDLGGSDELRRLPTCTISNDSQYVCCNPYHWSRLCKFDSPPPHYYKIDMELQHDESNQIEEKVHKNCNPQSLTTDGEGGRGSTGEWCKLAYWELAQRVGRLFCVNPPAVNIFSEQPVGNGLCLSTLARNLHDNPARQPNTTPDVVRRARSKIGLGVTLSQEADGIWVYNRSNSPIFTNSPTLYDNDSSVLPVFSVPSGHCLLVYDPSKPPSMPRHWFPPTGPVDPYALRISFAKGWGPNYKRQEVTACPCWLEVLLAPCR